MAAAASRPRHIRAVGAGIIVVDGSITAAYAAPVNAVLHQFHPAVLVVDDDLGVREAIANVLRDERFVVAMVAGGLKALELLNGGLRPALVLLDLWMPGLNGEGVIAAMKSDPSLRDIPIVVISAHPEARAEVEPTVDGFLTKPIDIDALIDAVHEHAYSRFVLDD